MSTQKLDDIFLVDFLKNNYSSISFLSGDTIKIIKKIEKITFTKKDKENAFQRVFNPAYKDAIDVLEFWERLIIDAIKYLKWHDLTEFPLDKGRKKRSPRNKKEKADVYNKISEGSLGVYNLTAYFKEFIEFERLLYGAEQFYRDHVFHIIRVWLTGQYILNDYLSEKNFKSKSLIEILEDGSKLTDYIDKDGFTSKGISKSLKNSATLYEGEEDAIWCLISLTHDLGYPLSKVEKVNSSLKKMISYFAKTQMEEFSFSFPQQNQFINDAILKYISSKIIEVDEDKSSSKKLGQEEYDTHIQAKYYLKFSRSFELFNHGLISCIVLVKNLIYFLETNFDHNPSTPLGKKEEARQFVIRREILRAIASHTCPEIYHLKPNTFSFLLLFSDEIQFWGRPTFELMSSGVSKKYDVYLTSYSEEEVSFEIKCNSQPNHKKESLISFFKEKAQVFKKILRVAVDSNKGRKFILKFLVTDETGLSYEFISKPSERPEMTLFRTTRNNGKVILHRQLEKLVPLHEKGEEKYTKLNKLIKEFHIFK